MEPVQPTGCDINEAWGRERVESLERRRARERESLTRGVVKEGGRRNYTVKGQTARRYCIYDDDDDDDDDDVDDNDNDERPLKLI